VELFTFLKYALHFDKSFINLGTKNNLEKGGDGRIILK